MSWTPHNSRRKNSWRLPLILGQFDVLFEIQYLVFLNALLNWKVIEGSDSKVSACQMKLIVHSWKANVLLNFDRTNYLDKFLEQLIINTQNKLSVSVCKF